MTDDLRRKLLIVREYFETNPDSIVIGSMNQPLRQGLSHGSANDQHKALLGIMDGARLGIVDFWSHAAIPENQYRVEALTTRGNWMEIGQVNYEPLVVDRDTGSTKIMDEAGVVQRDYSILDVFLEKFVFGADYKTVGGQDEWQRLVHRLLGK